MKRLCSTEYIAYFDEFLNGRHKLYFIGCLYACLLKCRMITGNPVKYLLFFIRINIPEVFVISFLFRFNNPRKFLCFSYYFSILPYFISLPICIGSCQEVIHWFLQYSIVE